MNPQQIIAELEKGCTEIEYFTEWNADYRCPFFLDGKFHLCDKCKAALSSAQNMSKAKDVWFEKLIDDVDIELMFTDIKDKEGKKFELSDEFMEIIGIWWKGKSKEIQSKLKGVENGNKKFDK